MQTEQTGSAPMLEKREETNDPTRDLETQLAQMRLEREQMSAMMLDASLANSSLPLPLAERIRQQFTDRSFAPAELSLVKEELSVSGDGLLKSWAAGLLTRV